MPKGVEHLDHALAYLRAGLVQKPLMPKGVEHDADKVLTAIAAAVQKPLMPKGVEHYGRQDDERDLHKSAEASDAERR